MNREFTKREKILLLIFAVLIILLGYFKLILEPINSQVDEYSSMESEEQAEIDIKMLQALQMSIMEKEIEKARENGINRVTPDYDNSSVLLPKLYHIMDRTVAYSMNFGEITTDGGIVMRPVEINFETRTYKKAREIIDRLYDTNYAMQIEDVTIQTRKTTDANSVDTYLSVPLFEAARQ